MARKESMKKYLFLGEDSIQTDPTSSKKYKKFIEVLGEGDSIAEMAREYPMPSIISKGRVYKLIEIELREK